jgi:hypothetical protein
MLACAEKLLRKDRCCKSGWNAVCQRPFFGEKCICTGKLKSSKRSGNIIGKKGGKIAQTV